MNGVFFPAAEAVAFEVETGRLTRRLGARGGALMMATVSFETGVEAKPHGHPHEQVTACLEGEFEFQVGEEVWTLRPGDSVYVAGGLRHGARCRAKGRLLDVFTPQREDFLEKGERP